MNSNLRFSIFSLAQQFKKDPNPAIASPSDLSFGTRLCALRDLEGIWPAEAIKNDEIWSSWSGRDLLDPRGQLMN
jgi:hypothetical protein